MQLTIKMYTLRTAK